MFGVWLFDWVVLGLHVCFSHLIIGTKQIYVILLLLLFLLISRFLLLHFLHKQVHPPHYKAQQNMFIFSVDKKQLALTDLPLNGSSENSVFR